MAKRSKKKGGKEAVVSFRCPRDVRKALDAYLEHLRENVPGGRWTRSSAAMNLVIRGLESWQDERK